jgi:hypothetical protein
MVNFFKGTKIVEQLYNKLLFLLKITKLTYYKTNTTKFESLNKLAITEYFDNSGHL